MKFQFIGVMFEQWLSVGALSIPRMAAVQILCALLGGCFELNSHSGGKITGQVILEQESNCSGVQAMLFLPVSVDSEELPPDRATVGVEISQQTDFDHRLAAQVATATTGPDGYFQFKEVPQGCYVLVLSKRGFGWRYTFDVSPSCSLPPVHLWKEQQVRGRISEDTTWLADHHYIVRGDIEVAPEVCLTIEPGVWVRFDGYWRFQVRGRLLAKGEQDSPITFTTNQGAWSYHLPQKGDWDRIQFESAEQGNILRWVRVEWANRGISCVDSSPQIQNSIIRHCAESGIAANLFSIPKIERCLIACCGSGVTMETNSAPIIFCNLLLDNEETGIAAKLFSSPQILNNWIAGNSTAVDISYGASALIEHNVIKNGKQGVKANQAKEIEVEHNIVEAQSSAAFYFATGTTVTNFTGNNVVGSLGWYIYLGGGYMPDVVATGNWWGTINRAVIAAKIRDGNDIPPNSRQNLGRVVFEPFESAPVQEAGLLLPSAANDW